MNQALAQILATRLAALPFASPEAGARVCGLARLWTGTGTDGQTIDKVPLPAAWSAEECERDNRYLVPDQHTPFIAFFEDGGTADVLLGTGVHGRESSLRLLIWLNPSLLSGPLSENQLIQGVYAALQVQQRATAGEYGGLYTEAAILPAETSLFGRYSYDTQTPLLLPPYRLLGLDLKCRYTPAPACPAAELPTIIDAAECPTFQ